MKEKGHVGKILKIWNQQNWWLIRDAEQGYRGNLRYIDQRGKIEVLQPTFPGAYLGERIKPIDFFPSFKHIYSVPSLR